MRETRINGDRSALMKNPVSHIYKLLSSPRVTNSARLAIGALEIVVRSAGLGPVASVSSSIGWSVCASRLVDLVTGVCVMSVSLGTPVPVSIGGSMTPDVVSVVVIAGGTSVSACVSGLGWCWDRVSAGAVSVSGGSIKGLATTSYSGLVSASVLSRVWG